MWLQLLREDLMVQVWLSILGIGTLVLGSVGYMMSRAGLSLRPIWWFAGFLLIIGLPQVIGHVYLGMRAGEAAAPARAALDGALESPEAQQRLFGADVDPALVRDAKPLFGEVLGEASAARFAVFPSGESVTLARFADSRAAERAWVAYIAATGLRGATTGNSERGFSATRAAGDRVYVLPMGMMLGVWSGPDDGAIRARMAAGGFVPPGSAPLAGASGGSSVAASELPFPWPVQAAALLALVLLASVYFLKGAAWAGAIPAARVAPLPAGELRARLSAVNALDVPFRVEPGDAPHELVAEWRIADAKWIDHARAHGMRKIHRVVMRLDEAAHAVRVTDHAASHDWSAGAGGVRIHWQRAVGINFFQYEHQRVFGLQVDASGRLQPKLSYAYTFNLQEMKAPLIAAVTAAGWQWKPVLLEAPKWLRWAVE
jgi:hypothetical protein